VILVDTSAWVEFDRATDSPVDRRLHSLISDDNPLATTDPIIMELASGAKDDIREQQLRRLLGRCTLLPFDAPTDFDAAARVYRRCRSQGTTPRGLIDCMIVAIALRNHATLLCQDRDLVHISHVMGVDLDEASA